MTIREIRSHRWGVRELYDKLSATTIANASNEELTLRELPQLSKDAELPNGHHVDYGTALCFLCIQKMLSRFARKTKPTMDDIEYIASEMMFKYKHWTVADLPTFVSMCIGSRIPTTRYGETEYELVVLDIPAIMGKLESYDRMRPNPQALQGGSPEKATEKELTDWHKTHLMDGTPYVWTDMDTCKKYWRDSPAKDDTDFKKTQESLDAQTKGGIVRTVDEVLKIRKNAQEPNV